MDAPLVFYRDWWEAISELPEELQLQAFHAVCAYAFTGAVSEDPMLRAFTKVMRNGIDRNAERYRSICDRNRENGKKGGRPKKTDAENQKNPVGILETQKTQTNPKNPDEPKKPNNNNSSNNNIIINNNISSSLQVRVRTREEIIGEFFADNRRAKIEALCMSTGASLSELMAAANEAVNDWELTSLPPHKDLRDEQAHLLAHIRKIIKNNKNNGTRKNITDNQTREEQNDRNKQHILARLAGNDKGGNFTA